MLPSFGIRVKGLGVPNPNFQVVSSAGFVRFLEFRRDFVAGNVTDERYEEERTHDDRGHVGSLFGVVVEGSGRRVYELWRICVGILCRLQDMGSLGIGIGLGLGQ